MEHDRYERRLWTVAVGLLLVVASWPATARGEEQSPTPKGVQPREITFENGLTILLVERHEQPTVACGLFYDVGGAIPEPTVLILMLLGLPAIASKRIRRRMA